MKIKKFYSNIDNNILDNLTSIIGYGISTIPYIGGTLSTIWFDIKGKIMVERFENFYKELVEELNKEFAEELKTISDRIASIDILDKGYIAAIIEEINERIEKENLSEKIKFLKNYFKNSLISLPNKNNFNERHFFIKTIGSMSLYECEILNRIVNNYDSIDIENINTDNIGLLLGTIDKLKSYGFILTERKKISFGVDDRLGLKIKISDFGKKFFDFCLKDID